VKVISVVDGYGMALGLLVWGVPLSVLVVLPVSVSPESIRGIEKKLEQMLPIPI